MDEDELKRAFRDAMVASSPPPPMSPAAALAAGRSARRRRTATWGAAVAGLAVVAITVGTVLVPQLTGGSGGAVIQAGGQSSDPGPVRPGVSVTPGPSGFPGTTGRPPGSGSPSGTGRATETSWPDGQEDRTATRGPRAEKSVTLLNDLGSSLPATFQAVDRQPVGDQWFGPLRSSQSQFADYYDGDKQVWEYMASTPVVREGSSGVGRLWIQVATKGTKKASDGSPCGAVAAAWPIKGSCQVLDVGGKKVGHVTSRPDLESDLDELVIHQYDDGTLVFVGQAAEFRRSGLPALDGQVFTRDALAALATDPRFHLD